jgi:hypothetical protein
MHPFLTRLGVRPEVQRFFQPYYHADAAGNLLFRYGDDLEHYGFAFHRIPATQQFWIAGNSNFAMIRQVFICASALEAIACLTICFSRFNHLDNLLFISTGLRPCTHQIQWLHSNLSGKKFSLVFSRDILGRICDLKIAAGISRIPVAVFISDDVVHVSFRHKNYVFSTNDFSLSALEKKSGYRFNMSAQKPPAYDSFFEQLKAQYFNSL